MVQVEFEGVPYEVVSVKGREWSEWREVVNQESVEPPFNNRYIRKDALGESSVAFLLEVRHVSREGADGLHDSLVNIVVPEDGSVQVSVFGGRAKLRRLCY